MSAEDLRRTTLEGLNPIGNSATPPLGPGLGLTGSGASSGVEGESDDDEEDEEEESSKEGSWGSIPAGTTIRDLLTSWDLLLPLMVSIVSLRGFSPVRPGC